MLAEMDHIIYLLKRYLRFTPRACSNVEAFHGKVNSGLLGTLIMPVADKNIFRDQGDHTLGSVHAGFPSADPGSFAIDQAVSPYHQSFAL